MKIIRRSKAEFEKVRPLLATRMSERSIKMVERVQVDGETQSSVAAHFAVTRQAIHDQIKRAETLIKSIPKDWVELNNVWLPPDKADEVMRMAEQLHIQHLDSQ